MNELLAQYIIEYTGLAYYADKQALLAQKVALRMTALEMSSQFDYLTYLQNGATGETELAHLAQELTIGETYFFRYKEQFKALEETVIPDLIASRQETRKLRIWSAGCASGEEAYSLSILLHQFPLQDWDISIVGTDINRHFLKQAGEGLFRDWAFRDNESAFKASYFQPKEQGWEILAPYRKWVSFRYHNLAQHGFPSIAQDMAAFDLILCRNVMIYFDAPTCRRLVRQFYETLTDGGWLVLGHAEMIHSQMEYFEGLELAKWGIYQKGAAPSPPIALSWEGDHFAPPNETPIAPWEGDHFASPNETPIAPWERDHFAPTTWQPFVFQEPTNQDIPPYLPPTAKEADLSLLCELADRGQWEKALAVCLDLLDKQKMEAKIHFYHALILEQTGNVSAAKEALRQTIYLNHRHALAHYHLGLLLQKEGNLKKATRAFQNTCQVLQNLADGDRVSDVEGLTVADLKTMAHLQLEVMAI